MVAPALFDLHMSPWMQKARGTLTVLPLLYSVDVTGKAGWTSATGDDVTKSKRVLGQNTRKRRTDGSTHARSQRQLSHPGPHIAADHAGNKNGRSLKSRSTFLDFFPVTPSTWRSPTLPHSHFVSAWTRSDQGNVRPPLLLCPVVPHLQKKTSLWSVVRGSTRDGFPGRGDAPRLVRHPAKTLRCDGPGERRNRAWNEAVPGSPCMTSSESLPHPN